MALKFRPVLATVCLIALLTWLGTLLPAGSRFAAAEESAGVPRLKTQFAAFHEEHDHDHAHGDHHGDDEHEEDEDWEEEEWDEEDWEREQAYAEHHRTELELLLGQMRIVQEVASIAEDADRSAMLAILSVLDDVDEPEQAEALLLDLLSRSRSGSVKRLIRMELTEVYGNMEEPEKAIDQVRLLVDGE